MREIKFRAWYLGYRDKAAPRPHMLYENKPGDCLVWKNNTQNLKVMQYTGLKDRNGREIYEGDIVKGAVSMITEIDIATLAEMQEELPFKSEVKFENGAFQIEIQPWQSWHSLDLIRAHDIEYEVIGNVFENPELLR